MSQECIEMLPKTGTISKATVEPQPQASNRIACSCGARHLCVVLLIGTSVLLLCLAFSFRYATSSSRAANQTPPPARKCFGKLIPGIDQMARGIDITKFDLFPMDNKHLNGLRKTVLEFSCAQGRTWHSSSDGGNETYQMPDQVVGVSANSDGSAKATILISENMAKFKQQRAASMELFVNSFQYGAYSAGTGLTEVMENVFHRNRTLTETSMSVSSHTVDFSHPDRLTVNADFLHFLRYRCTGSFESMPEVYEEFVETFGTHYFEIAKLGGLFYMRTSIENAYIYQSSQTDLKASLGAFFFTRISGTGQVQSSNGKISETIMSTNELSFNYYGGYPVKISPDDARFMKAWVPLVQRNPWILGGRLVAIETLIGDDKTRNEVRKAVELHMAKAYLRELKTTLQVSGYQVTEEEAENVNQIEHKLRTRSVETIDGMVRSIERFLAKIEDAKARKELKQAKDNLDYFCSGVFDHKPTNAQLNQARQICSQMDQKMSHLLGQTTLRLDETRPEVSAVTIFIEHTKQQVGPNVAKSIDLRAMRVQGWKRL